jgi:hypothetical protein
MTRTSLDTINSDGKNMVLEWRYDRKLQWKYGTRMEVWPEVTVNIWYLNGGMTGSYGKNMVLEWRYERKLQWKYGTRMVIWA